MPKNYIEKYERKLCQPRTKKGCYDMKKRSLAQIGIFILLFCTFLINAKNSSAYDYEISFGESIFVESDYSIAFVDIKGVESKKAKIKVEITNVAVYNDNGNVVDDTITIGYTDEAESYEDWSVKTGKTLTFTTYAYEGNDTLRFSTDSLNDFSLNVKITKISDAELTISCHKPITMKDNGLKKVHAKVYYGGEDVSEFADFKVKASKKNLVDIDTADSDMEDYFYLEGNGKAGKCKITVTAKYKGQTCSDSFILKIKSTLKKNLYVIGNLDNYNTRSNVFGMSLTNRSQKPITIYSKGAVALDEDYVSFDRNLKMTKSRKKITIKPGKSKAISWKVLGKITWYKVGDFEIHFKCKYKGKVSWLSVKGSSVYIWKNKKWKKLSEF